MERSAAFIVEVHDRVDVVYWDGDTVRYTVVRCWSKIFLTFISLTVFWKDVAQVNGIYYNANAISSGTKEKLASIGNGSGAKQELAEIVDEASHTKIIAMLESAQEGIECTNVKVGIYRLLLE
jgi:hypothetical protein